MKIFFIFALLILMPHESRASTCAQQSMDVLLKNSDFVFAGKVEEREKLPGEQGGLCKYEGEHCGPKIAKISVNKIWKGENINKSLKIYSEDGRYCLGTYFHKNAHYLVFAKNEGGSLIDLGGCATEELAYAIEEKLLNKLNKKTKNKIELLDKDIMGSWESFGDAQDMGFENVRRLKLEFEKNYKFSAITYMIDDKEIEYSGIHYVLDNELVIYDEDGFQPYLYKIENGFLILESLEKYRYKLRRL